MNGNMFPSASAYLAMTASLMEDQAGMEQAEAKKKPHVCKVCGSRFTQYVNLRIHKRIHTGERPYTCDICEKTFIQLGHLSQHRRLHTGEKPYKCLLCEGVAFIQLCQLQSHQKRAHAMYPSSARLGRQAVVHKPDSNGRTAYQCGECQRSFAALTTLHRHLKSQHNLSPGPSPTLEKPFHCDICGRGFSQSGNLKTHKRIHTGEKPYECLECEKRFTQFAGLKQHKLTHRCVAARTSAEYESGQLYSVEGPFGSSDDVKPDIKVNMSNSMYAIPSTCMPKISYSEDPPRERSSDEPS